MNNQKNRTMRLFLYKLIFSLLFIGQTFLAAAQCENDTTPPLAVCQSNITLVDQLEVTPDLLNEGSSDLCTAFKDLDFRLAVHPSSTETPITSSVTFSKSGQYVVNLWVLDEAGNTNRCWTDVKVILSEECENDTEAPELTCLNSLQTIEGEVLIFAQDIISMASDNCTDRFDFVYGLQLAEDFTGVMPTEPVLEFTAPDIYGVYVWIADQQGNSTYCKSQIIVSETIDVEGFVYNDANQNCIREAEETGLNQFVKITVLENNIPIYTIIEQSTDGLYNARVLKPTTTNASVQIELANDGIPNCEQASITAIPQNSSGLIQLEDLGAQLTDGCADLGVTIEGINAKCGEEGLFVMQFYNGGTEIANPTITLEFSNAVDISHLFASHIYEYQATDEDLTAYTFQVNNLLPGEEGGFFLFGKETCDFDNQTQVITASISAENACSNLWNGAEMKITKDCLGGEVKFKVENVGKEDMLAPINYIVVEDVIMMRQGTIQLPAGGSENIKLPANGATYFIQANQVPDYPWQATTAVVSEGCSTDQSKITTGVVAQFPLENTTPHIDVAVIEHQKATVNRLSALPLGIGEEHLLATNTAIEYAIEYANEGNELVDELTIKMELSESLDINTFNLTYATHSTFDQTINGNVITFTFPNIGLVSSTISEKEGSGLLKFTIAQQQDVPANTLIENKTSVQFDAASPLNSSVFHTIGALALSTSTNDVLLNTIELTVSPNPFSTYTIFTFENERNDWMQFELHDVNGATVWEQQLNTSQLRLPRKNLHKGFYFYVLKKEGQPVGVGKLFVE